tara:strand:+ start:325 stop:726 length:402 start_codon:yes stop_codon:yes gene_type:complete
MNNETLQNLRKAGFIVKLQGKEFVLFAGLQVLARELGLNSVNTELISIDKDSQTTIDGDQTVITKATGLTIFKATVSGDMGTFTSYGDASPKNVGRMIAPHLIRMAETRAIARALRLYCAIGMTSLEELGGGQ